MPHLWTGTTSGERLLNWLRAEQGEDRPVVLGVHRAAGGSRALRRADELLVRAEALLETVEVSEVPVLRVIEQLQGSARELLELVPRSDERSKFWEEWERYERASDLFRPEPEDREAMDGQPRSLEQARMVQRTLRRLVDVLVSQRLGFWPRGALRSLGLSLLVASIVGALIATGVTLARPTNFIENAELTTSSRYLFWPTHEMLFHTDQDDPPWATYDLKDVRTFSHLVVENTGTFPERAIPLAIEASLDGKTFHEVALRTTPFAVWKATVEPTQARYVRLKTKRRSYLHLKRVEVRR